MRNFSQRLDFLIKKLGHSTSSFEKACGVSNGTFAKAIANNKEIYTGTLLLIANAFPEINLRWLIQEVGEPLENNLKPESHNGKTVPEYDSIHIRETLKYVREELERQHTQLVKTTRATEELEREVNDLKAQVKGLAS